MFLSCLIPSYTHYKAFLTRLTCTILNEKVSLQYEPYSARNTFTKNRHQVYRTSQLRGVISINASAGKAMCCTVNIQLVTVANTGLILGFRTEPITSCLPLLLVFQYLV
ncbi:hypothetical protein CW304_29310 [Bacillus sp. UFRGS-B20]|nr:hypothetical protein CW304_29310 [Bacillus sp. UFRGS-B20]